MARPAAKPRPAPKPQKKYPSALTIPCQQLLSKGLKQLGFETSGKLFDDIQAFLAELELWNPNLGLVEAGSEDLIVKHVLDSLAAYPVFAHYAQDLSDDQPYLDVGSGAGFPALLLLLAQRALTGSCVAAVLVDKQQRRCQFLSNAIARLGLSSRVKVSQELVEKLDRHHFGLLTARAFKPLDQECLAVLNDSLHPSGTMILFKGRREKVRQECLDAKLGVPNNLDDLQKYPAVGCAIMPLKVPFLNEERHLLIISHPGTATY